MPPRTENSKKKEVIRRWLITGETRDEIAKAMDIGAGNVSNIVRDWESGLDKGDHDAVRHLAVQSSKIGLTLKDAVDVARLYNRGKQMSLKTEVIEDFLVDVNDICVEQKLDTKEIVSTIKQILALCRAQKVSPHQIAETLEQKLKQLEDIKAKIQTVNKEKEKIKQEKAAALIEKGVTEEDIKEHINVRDALKERGLSISNVKRVLALMENCEKLDFAPAEIVSTLSKLKDVKKAIANHENKIQDLQGEIVFRDTRKKVLDEEIKQLESGKKVMEDQLINLQPLSEAIITIRRLNVEDRYVVAIGTLLSRLEFASINIEGLLKELEAYGSFTKLKRDLAEKIARLRQEEKDLLLHNSKLEALATILKKKCAGSPDEASTQPPKQS